MTKPVRVEGEAEEELRAAVAWYEEQRPGLGADLLVEAGRVIETFRVLVRKCLSFELDTKHTGSLFAAFRT